MLARKQEINLQLSQLADAVILGLVLWICYYLRARGIIELDSSPEIPPFEYFLWMLAVIIPFGPFLLELQGYYNYPMEKTLWRSVGQMARAGLWLAVLLTASAFFLKLYVPARSVPILFVILTPVALLLRERIGISLRKRSLEAGADAERIIIAGEPGKIKEIEDGLTPTQRLETRVVARIDLAANDTSALVAAIHEHSVGRVILAFGELELTRVQLAIEACELEGVEAWLCADFIRTSIARPTYEVLARRPMLVFRTTPEISWALLVKDFTDRCGAALILLVTSPLLVAIAIGIRITSPGPIVFKQRRAGRFGRPFTMYKFRSMQSDAEMLRAELAVFNQMSGPVFKIGNDPRITPLGRWLRKTSLDEFPQLFNVLRGEMSLVGPRPLPIYEVEQFERDAHRRRLSMKPGLTCIWQIHGRSNVTSFEKWVEMDLDYIDNWSLALDAWILIRTVPVVVFGLGAK
jgi:exopolysaccharide biosynthesis polyprenyl glycosylphosphotransferase